MVVKVGFESGEVLHLRPTTGSRLHVLQLVMSSFETQLYQFLTVLIGQSVCSVVERSEETLHSSKYARKKAFLGINIQHEWNTDTSKQSRTISSPRRNNSRALKGMKNIAQLKASRQVWTGRSGDVFGKTKRAPLSEQRPSEKNLPLCLLDSLQRKRLKNICYKVVFHHPYEQHVCEELATEHNRESRAHRNSVSCAALEDQRVLLSNEDSEPTDGPVGLWEIILSTDMWLPVTPSWTHTHTPIPDLNTLTFLRSGWVLDTASASIMIHLRRNH